MKTRNILLTLAMLFVGLTMCFAENLHMGTWKLNEAKSKISAGAPKNMTVKYEADGDNVKVTIDGVDGKGNSTHNEWTGKLDAKDYPVTGDPASDTRAVKQINDHTLEFTVKKDGKVTITGKSVASADGKTRTVTASGVNADGKKMETTSFFDKQ